MKIWLIGDTHFDHTNIIRYCHRPFRSVEEMNEVIFENWNGLVDEDDYVLFVGDFVFGRRFKYWDHILNGEKIMLKGNHDRYGLERLIINAKGHRLLLIHDPADIEHRNGEWVIHGHKHNSTPLMDFDRKMVNVSVENIGYKPIALKDIIKLIEEGGV